MKALLLVFLFLTVLPISLNAQQVAEACIANRNAPPMSAYHWPPDTTVKVYFTRGLFTQEQRAKLFEAMTVWTKAAQRAGADVRFIDGGDRDSLINCHGCLTVTRSEVHKRDRKHYAFFNPLGRYRDGLLISAWIDFDIATTDPKYE